MFSSLNFWNFVISALDKPFYLYFAQVKGVINLLIHLNFQFAIFSCIKAP